MCVCVGVSAVDFICLGGCACFLISMCECFNFTTRVFYRVLFSCVLARLIFLVCVVVILMRVVRVRVSGCEYFTFDMPRW